MVVLQDTEGVGVCRPTHYQPVLDWHLTVNGISLVPTSDRERLCG